MDVNPRAMDTPEIAVQATAGTEISNPSSLPEFTIELNQSSKLLFKAPAEFFQADILTAFDLFMPGIPKPLVDLFEYTYWIWYYTQNEKYMEMEGIVEAVNSTDLTMGKLVLINALYELESYCTSIIAKQSDGQIIHARNLDFGNTDAMRKISYRARFVRNGEYVYDAVMFAGTVGVYTGMKGGAFSVSEN